MNIVRPKTAPIETRPAGEWEPLRMMRDMMRWDPFGELAPIFPAGKEMFFPDVDVKETPEAYVFKADLPGFKDDDVEVTLTANRLTLSGKREEERREEKDKYFATERSYGSFSRSFTLPAGTDVDRVNAELKDGVLTIHVAKKPEVQAKRIPVATNAPKPH